MGLMLADSEHSSANYLLYAGVNDTSDALQLLHYLFSDTNGEILRGQWKTDLALHYFILLFKPRPQPN